VKHPWDAFSAAGPFYAGMSVFENAAVLLMIFLPFSFAFLHSGFRFVTTCCRIFSEFSFLPGLTDAVSR
jgi:hypothetical protein